MIKPYYQDSSAQIYHGDWHEILPQVGFVGAIITDPPYGVGIDYGIYDDNLASTTEMVMEFVNSAQSICRVLAFSGGKSETSFRLMKENQPRWVMCWYKGAQSTASPIGFNDWEMIFVYGDDICTGAHDYFFAQPEKLGRYGHPCPKPERFFTALIARLSKNSETIVDPFMGSGTCLRAAKDLGRKSVGIEIEERYCEIAAKRMEQEVFQFA